MFSLSRQRRANHLRELEAKVRKYEAEASNSTSEELQRTIDTLREENAFLRAQLDRYRNTFERSQRAAPPPMPQQVPSHLPPTQQPPSPRHIYYAEEPRQAYYQEPRHWADYPPRPHVASPPERYYIVDSGHRQSGGSLPPGARPAWPPPPIPLDYNLPPPGQPTYRLPPDRVEALSRSVVMDAGPLGRSVSMSDAPPLLDLHGHERRSSLERERWQGREPGFAAQDQVPQPYPPEIGGRGDRRAATLSPQATAGYGTLSRHGELGESVVPSARQPSDR